jgi:RHS repeat-associated protein
MCFFDPRFVGDPIDVVTGANTDAPIDLTQRGPIPFQWARYYNSTRCHIHGSLGWGHTHDFDRTLTRDLDGLRYEDPTGRILGFIDLAIGASQTADGTCLTRTGDQSYVIATSNQPDQEFRFTDGSEFARLARWIKGTHSIEARYANGVLSEIIDSRGRLIRVVSDRAKRVLKLELIDSKTNQAAQALLTYEYDAAGNLVRATDVYKTTLIFAYDAAKRMIRRTDRLGYTFHFRYDEQGRCIHSRGDDGLFEVFLEYQPEVNSTTVRRGDGGTWIYFYDGAGAITQIIDPYGNARRFVQDDAGRTVQEIDANGNITELHYDELGQHDFRIDANGNALPPRDESPEHVDPLAYRLPRTPLQWEFGNLVRRELIEQPKKDDAVLCQFPAAVYNAVLGFAPSLSKTATGDAAKAEQADDYARPLERVGPTFTERWKYDANGNLIEHQDRDGKIARAVYGSWNSLRQAIDPLGHAIRFEHDREGLVSKVIDAGGTVTEYGYDLRDQLVEIRSQGRVRETYQRDAAGTIIGKKDAHGRLLVNWEIGPGNLETARMLASGETNAFTYDERGRMLSARAPDGEATFACNDHGDRTADLRDGIGVVHEYHDGMLSSTIVLEKFKTAYAFAGNGDLLITDPRGGQHRFVRSASGLMARFLADGDRELCQFDHEGRCVRKALTRWSGRATWMRTYGYSWAGDLVAVSDSEHGVTRYTYDDAHRLAEEAAPGVPTRRFGFDAAGNVMFQPGLNDVVIDLGNRLQKANGDQFTHNDRDHVSVRKNAQTTTRYEYNELDMLVRCDVNGAAWTATYDPLGRRISKTWQGRTTSYYWDDFRLAAELRHDGSVRVYVYADEVALVPFVFIDYASLEAHPKSGRRYYLFTNQVGAPIRVEDSAGNRCWSARIDPYGRAEVRRESTAEMPLRFPGHYFDAETGLHYNRFRYYSPELGRYLQSDPLGQAGGINLYAYPTSPLIDVDLDGLSGTKVGPPPAPPRRTGPTNGVAPRARATCPYLAVGQISPTDLVKSGAIKLEGDPKYHPAMMKDLHKIASTQTGQRVLSQIQNNHANHGVGVNLKQGEPPSQSGGPGEWNRRDPKTGTPGQPFDSDVKYTPGRNYGDQGGTPSDVALLHELDHAQRSGSGNDRKDYPNPDESRFPNAEEHAAVTTENAYRKETGQPPRVDDTGAPSYNVLP